MRKELIKKGSNGLNTEDAYISSLGTKANGMMPEDDPVDESTSVTNADIDTQIPHRYVLNGLTLNIGYNKKLSAKQNRKLLKEHLKAYGLGDKSTATGLVGEYLNDKLNKNVYALSKKDAKWLHGRSKLYGYTTDGDGNRSYYRKQNPLLRGAAIVAGGLLGGPTGAFLGNLLTKKIDPSGASGGFWSPSKLKVEKVTSETPQIGDYTSILAGYTALKDGSYIKDNDLLFMDDKGLNYKERIGYEPYGASTYAHGVVDKDGNRTFKGVMKLAGEILNPVNDLAFDVFNYYRFNPNSSRFEEVNGTSSIVYNANTKKWMKDDEEISLDRLDLFKEGGSMNQMKQNTLVDLLELILLVATFGMIGYAKSQGTELDFDSALLQVLQTSLNEPQAIQQLVLNEKLIEAGVRLVLLNDPNLYLQLQLPEYLKKKINEIFLKNSKQSQVKTKKGMNGTKLDYIKELKGICPEGYEIEYFAAGGHICPRCARKKQIEEAKCGKKMKAKKHEGGGVSAAVNEVKENMLKNKKDSTNTKQTLSKTTFNDGRDELLLKTSPKTYDKAKHLKLIDEFRKNGYSYKGWSKAKADSLTRYNVLLGSDEDSDWSF